MTAPEPLPMTDEQADYLLGAAMGLAQAARLIPTSDLAQALVRRRNEIVARGTSVEADVARHEWWVAMALQALVIEAEALMDARGELLRAQTTMQPEMPAEAQVDPTTLPPSRRPLADDDVWV